MNYRVVAARKSFKIFRQNTWFLENKIALSEFLYGILEGIEMLLEGVPDRILVRMSLGMLRSGA